MTIAGFLPPISTMQGLGNLVEKRWKSCLKPTSNDPVKVRPSTSGCIVRPSPTTRPLPATQLMVPRGRPASSKISTSLMPDSGVSDDGLQTTVLPVTSAAATGAPSSAYGKFQGATTAHTPK